MPRRRPNAPPRRGLRGDRVRDLRRRHDLSQMRLAQLMGNAEGGVDQTYISLIERGGRSLNSDALVALCEVLDTNPGYLLDMTEDDRPHSALERELSFAVRDADERAKLEELFTAILSLDPSLSDDYYRALSVIYAGLLDQARNRGRSAESPPIREG